MITTGFSPDGDGVNDVWDLINISSYPDAEVSVFNRWGAKMYSAKGDIAPWDGRYSGSTLPTGSYYFVVDLHHEQKPEPITGIVSIIR